MHGHESLGQGLVVGVDGPPALLVVDPMPELREQIGCLRVGMFEYAVHQRPEGRPGREVIHRRRQVDQVWADRDLLQRFGWQGVFVNGALIFWLAEHGLFFVTDQTGVRRTSPTLVDLALPGPCLQLRQRRFGWCGQGSTWRNDLDLEGPTGLPGPKHSHGRSIAGLGGHCVGNIRLARASTEDASGQATVGAVLGSGIPSDYLRSGPGERDIVETQGLTSGFSR